MYCYRIDMSGLLAHPYQLFKREADGWKNLSVYVSIRDAVMILLKELFSSELVDEIDHGQATINPGKIMEKISRGDKTVSIYGSSNNEMFRIDFDVDFEDLVERK